MGDGVMGEVGFRWFTFRLWLRRAPEAIWWWVAFRLPHQVAYFAAVRLLAHASQGPWGNEHPGSVTAFAAMERWRLCGKCGAKPSHVVCPPAALGEVSDG